MIGRQRQRCSSPAAGCCSGFNPGHEQSGLHAKSNGQMPVLASEAERRQVVSHTAALQLLHLLRKSLLATLTCMARRFAVQAASASGAAAAVTSTATRCKMPAALPSGAGVLLPAAVLPLAAGTATGGGSCTTVTLQPRNAAAAVAGAADSPVSPHDSSAASARRMGIGSAAAAAAAALWVASSKVSLCCWRVRRATHPASAQLLGIFCNGVRAGCTCLSV